MLKIERSNIMQYKLIVVDMDGTLLNTKHQVSKETRETLAKAMEQGVKVGIATGRIYPSARYYGNLLGLSTPIIACNGAIVKDEEKGEIIFSDAMQKDDVIKIINICKKHDIYFHFYDHDRFYIEREKYNSFDFQDWTFKESMEDQVGITQLEDAISYVEKNNIDVLKITILDEDMNKLENIKKQISQISTIEIAKSWYNNMEIMNKEVSKGKGIEALAKKLGIEKDEIIAFGDNYNDLSMKDYVKTFVAMENGVDSVKEKADYVTASNDKNGVAKGIKKFVLAG